MYFTKRARRFFSEVLMVFSTLAENDFEVSERQTAEK